MARRNTPVLDCFASGFICDVVSGFLSPSMRTPFVLVGITVLMLVNFFFIWESTGGEHE